MSANPILITQGTQTAVAADLVGTTNYPVMKLDVGAAGATSAFTGTLGAITNLAGGTVTSLVKGTISAGTVDLLKQGTVDAVSQLPPNSWGASVTTGTSTLGTIKAAVAGSAIYVTDLIISAGTATTLVLGMGGTSTPFIGSLSFNTNGGLAMPFRVPLAVTLGSALVYQQSANNTLSITAVGFVR